jgi:uncharacterized protein YabN with tetrapyrrole methylase and pyrophosphatase domain
MSSGSLIIVGTGIQLGQATIEAEAYIQQADKVLFLATDPVTIDWIEQLNTTAESLQGFYSTEKDRLTTYKGMVEHILSYVRQGLKVCVAFYGHPGVFVYPSHESIKLARNEGFDAKMLPGVSSEDCLFCDLGIDPGVSGCQSFEATDFLVHKRNFDTTSNLILWQIGVVGDIGYKQQYNLDNLRILTSYLEQFYAPDHAVIVYEAARYVICEPKIQHTTLSRIAEAEITPISTLYIPPKSRAIPDLDMLAQLGIPSWYIQKRARDS